MSRNDVFAHWTLFLDSCSFLSHFFLLNCVCVCVYWISCSFSISLFFPFTSHCRWFYSRNMWRILTLIYISNDRLEMFVIKRLSISPHTQYDIFIDKTLITCTISTKWNQFTKQTIAPINWLVYVQWMMPLANEQELADLYAFHLIWWWNETDLTWTHTHKKNN